MKKKKIIKLSKWNEHCMCVCVCAHFSLQESLEEESPEYYSYSLSLDDGIIGEFFFLFLVFHLLKKLNMDTYIKRII